MALADPAGVAAAMRYAQDVCAGRNVACRLVQLACRRFLDDRARADAGDGPWEFQPRLAERPMLFAGLMPNIKGPEAGRPLRLMDWQRFVFANIFGFTDRITGARRFRQGIVFVPRGNGKTSISAPLALYLSFLDQEGGAEGYAAAVSRDQARILFDTAREMVRRSATVRQRYDVQVLANALYQPRSSSVFRPISSDAKALDGLNVQVAVCDEIGSHRTSKVYDVLLTATGKRKHPLILSISTATDNNTGIGKQLWDYMARVLEGTHQDESVFGLIYTIDPEDDPWDEATWRKANPGWGQTVQPESIRAIFRQARHNPANEAVAFTRHLNVWVSADEALFSMRAWKRCAQPVTLDDFEGRECHLGLDLASKTDLAAVSIVFPSKDAEKRDAYAVFARCFLNEAAIQEERNAYYPAWTRIGAIEETRGNETDFGVIEDALRELCKRFRVLSVAYDPWAATQLAQRLTQEGVPMVEFRASTQNFSEPTKELDAAMQAGRLAHDGNPVLEWCIGNVVGRYDARSNVYPRKARPENKIDAAVATIMAIGRCMAMKPKPSIYETRGVLLVG